MSLTTKMEASKTTESKQSDSVGLLINELQRADTLPNENGASAFFSGVGAFFLSFLNGFRRRVKGFYQFHMQGHFHRLDLFWLRVKKWFSKRGQGFLFRFYLFVKFFVEAKNVVRGGYRSHPDKSVLQRVFYALRAFGQGLRNNGLLFVHGLNYVLPLAAVFAFVQLILYTSSLTYAFNVEYNGEHVGYIPNETVYDQAQAKLQERLLYQDGDEILDTIPKFHLTIVDSANLTEDPAELTNTIIRSSSADMVEATGIMVDGEFIGAVKDVSQVNAILSEMLKKYETNTAGETISFLKEIDRESGLFLQKNVTTETKIINKLTSQTEQDVYYTAVSGDTPSGIASAYEMSTDDLVALNPTILTDLKIGQQVLVNKSQPYLPVKSTRPESYTVSVPFETIYVDSSDLYQGQKKTLVEGQKGESSYTDEVSYVDGVEVSRTNLSVAIVSQPVTQKIARGTKVMPKAVTSYSTGPQSNLGFIRPVNGNSAYVSQRFTGQYGHTGIDIAFRGNGYGTPIVATYPGTVEYSGWRGTYGNLVIINHGNGLKTYYAHCSKLTVSAGQTVAQGQQIANVGSTGRSTGNHCHYMVVVNGAYKNPLSYIPGY